MEPMKRFSAPWGKTLGWVSVLSTLLCVGVLVLLAMVPHQDTIRHFVLPFGFIFALQFLAALFTIRGYTVTPDAILVHRLFWDTRLPREGLVSATVEPKVMNCSLRICGNGGLFSFSGWFWSKSLRRYKAYVTDLNRTVVLRWEKRTAVVSPDDPEGFVQELMG